MDAMRIVQVLPSLGDGGVERGTVDSNRLYVEAGHESWVISAGGPRAARIVADGGRHVTLDVRGKNPLSAPWRAWALRRALREIRPDVVHFRSRVPGWLTLWANRALGLPTVSTLHGLNHPGLYSSVMVRADRVICVSTAGRAFVEEKVLPLEGVEAKAWAMLAPEEQAALVDLTRRFGGALRHCLQLHTQSSEDL